MENSTLSKCLSTFSPISLSEMSAVRLMNRVDTKYVTTLDQLSGLLEMAAETYRVQDIDGLRIASYDTLYYDTPSLEMYIRHHNRQLHRQKVRVRRYVDTGDLFLEIKTKLNTGRTKKKRIELAAMPLACLDGISADAQAFMSERCWYDTVQLMPALRTEFHRITLVNLSTPERLTIDFALRFTNPRTRQVSDLGDMAIIELKRDGMNHSPMVGFLQALRIHPYKVSKYCIGTALTDPGVKRNRFLPKLRYINRLINNQSELIN